MNLLWFLSFLKLSVVYRKPMCRAKINLFLFSATSECFIALKMASVALLPAEVIPK